MGAIEIRLVIIAVPLFNIRKEVALLFLLSFSFNHTRYAKESRKRSFANEEQVSKSSFSRKVAKKLTLVVGVTQRDATRAHCKKMFKALRQVIKKFIFNLFFIGSKQRSLSNLYNTLQGLG